MTGRVSIPTYPTIDIPQPHVVTIDQDPNGQNWLRQFYATTSIQTFCAMFNISDTEMLETALTFQVVLPKKLTVKRFYAALIERLKELRQIVKQQPDNHQVKTRLQNFNDFIYESIYQPLVPPQCQNPLPFCILEPQNSVDKKKQNTGKEKHPFDALITGIVNTTAVKTQILKNTLVDYLRHVTKGFTPIKLKCFQQLSEVIKQLNALFACELTVPKQTDSPISSAVIAIKEEPAVDNQEALQQGSTTNTAKQLPIMDHGLQLPALTLIPHVHTYSTYTHTDNHQDDGDHEKIDEDFDLVALSGHKVDH